MTIEKMSKFCPAIRNALMNHCINLDDALEEYEDIYPAFRGIKMGKDETRPLCRSDFESQFERANQSKQEEYKERREMYSCSCFLSKEKLYENYNSIRKSPDRFRYAKGFIKKHNGAVIIDQDSEHVHWFLYERGTPEQDFRVI